MPLIDDLRNEVGGLLDKVLELRERKIIYERFGLGGQKPKTLAEIGKKWGVTREGARQLKNNRTPQIPSRSAKANHFVRCCNRVRARRKHRSSSERRESDG